MMDQKTTASADTAPKTIKAQTSKAAPEIETAKVETAKVETAKIQTAKVEKAKIQTAKKSAGSPRTKVAPVVRAAAVVPVAAVAASPKVKAAAAEGIGLEALLTAGQDNLAACMTCGTIVAKGLQTLGNQVMTLARSNIDANVAATKSLMAAKTPHELVDLQTSLARDRLEGMANDTAKIGALTMNVASQALEPLRSRFDANTRSVLRPFGL
jgi:phasin family protein